MFIYNRVLEGDCTQLLKTVPAESIGLVLTDPPYFVRYRDRRGRTIANDSDPASVLHAFNELYRVLRPDTFCISFYGWNSVDAFIRSWRGAGFQLVGHLVWHKDYSSRTGFLRARHEQAYLLAKGRPERPAAPLDDVRPWHYSGNRRHPTEKDVRVLTPLIETFSKPGDVVLDPFAGSGSTLEAAARMQRRFLGIELDPHHCHVIRNRLVDFGEGAPDLSDSDPEISQRGELRALWRWLLDHDQQELAEVVRQAL